MTESLILGLSSGSACLATCGMVMFPYLMAGSAGVKKIVVDLIENDSQINHDFNPDNGPIIKKLFQDVGAPETTLQLGYNTSKPTIGKANSETVPQTIVTEESLSLQEIEEDMIKKALIKHKGKRKNAAKELGISERTLYRKINEYNIH